MNGPLPPLTALRAFEAAGRHLSFRRAAEELHVTPAAISHQIKLLEEYLGVPLFKRANRGLLLTDAAQLCLPGLRDGFDAITRAMARVRQDQGRTLTVSVPPSFAAKWLVPRLDRFRAAYPDIDVRLDATNELADFNRGEVDLAVRYGRGRYPGLRVDRLLSEEVSPVCSPALLKGVHPIRRPADLRWHTLLHAERGGLDETWPDWRMWLLAAGVRDVDPTRGPTFNPMSMAIQAAIEGHGVALGSNVLVARDLAEGRLVKPFALSVSAAFGYYVVCPDMTAHRPKIVAFRDWILAETRAEPHRRDEGAARPSDRPEGAPPRAQKARRRAAFD